jgi:hypothetical protein
MEAYSESMSMGIIENILVGSIGVIIILMIIGVLGSLS